MFLRNIQINENSLKFSWKWQLSVMTINKIKYPFIFSSTFHVESCVLCLLESNSFNLSKSVKTNGHCECYSKNYKDVPISLRENDGQSQHHLWKSVFLFTDYVIFLMFFTLFFYVVLNFLWKKIFLKMLCFHKKYSFARYSIIH